MSDLFANELELKRWINRAAYALQSLFNRDSGQFQRSESPETPYQLRHTGATSANRAFLACIEYLAFAGNRGGAAQRGIRTCATRLINDYYAGQDATFRSHSNAHPNMFTDSQALLALTACCSSHGIALLERNSAKKRTLLMERHREIALSLTGNLLRDGGARLHPDQANSPLATLHALRAIDSAVRVWHPAQADANSMPSKLLTSLSTDERRRHKAGASVPGESLIEPFTALLRSAARDEALRQLGLHSASDPEFDPASLLSAASVLQRVAGRSARTVIVRGIEVLAERQDTDGSWRADMLSTPGGRVIYVSSMELALGLANLLIADLSHGDSELRDVVSTMLARTYSLIEAGYIDRMTGQGMSGSTPEIGWGNDRTRRTQAVEVWSTALALQCLIRTDRVLQMIQHTAAMKGFRVQHSGPSISRWPDLEPILPTLLDEDALAYRLDSTLGRASDPSTGRKIVTGIIKDIVEPILKNNDNRPGRVASLLLYGPPGTRKTSLVKSIAQALRWPLVTVSPPDFLQDGIGGFEKHADQIFARLNRLRHVVIFFDECEELFRRRLSVATPEYRTQGAFITSGMLPRLQELRDSGWTLFVIATNTELEELDTAVTRPGRLDVQQRIGHPTVEAQLEHLVSLLSELRQAQPKKTELQAIRSALRQAEIRRERDEQPLSRRRLKVKEQLREGCGPNELRELANLREAEAQLPWVTFKVIERLARDFTDTKITTKPFSDQLEELLETSRSRNWS